MIRFSTQLMNLRASQIAALIDAGSGPGRLLICGDARPQALSGSSNVLAELQLSGASFSDPVDGVIVSNDIAPVAAVAAGTPIWFLATDSDYNPVFDGQIGLLNDANADLVIDRLDVIVGRSIVPSSLTFSEQS